MSYTFSNRSSKYRKRWCPVVCASANDVSDDATANRTCCSIYKDRAACRHEPLDGVPACQRLRSSNYNIGMDKAVHSDGLPVMG